MKKRKNNVNSPIKKQESISRESSDQAVDIGHQRTITSQNTLTSQNSITSKNSVASNNSSSNTSPSRKGAKEGRKGSKSKEEKKERKEEEKERKEERRKSKEEAKKKKKKSREETYINLESGSVEPPVLDIPVDSDFLNQATINSVSGLNQSTVTSAVSSNSTNPVTNSSNPSQNNQQMVRNTSKKSSLTKQGTVTKSPPVICVKDSSGKDVDRDDISLYGTPKEEDYDPNMSLNQGTFMASEMSKSVGPSFMRNQIEALFQPSDNKLAMKLFGSKKALMNERLRQKESGHWIIHPCSNFRSLLFILLWFLRLNFLLLKVSIQSF